MKTAISYTPKPLEIQRSSSWFYSFLKTLTIVALIIGIFCRFYNLDSKALSNDETFSSTYIYGHSLTEIIDTQIVSVDELQNYQRVNSEESVTDSVKRLIDNPYVFPPLYGILMQPWARLVAQFTDNPAIISRSLAALISLLAFPCIYWLSWELSGSIIMGWLATAFLAISPFHLQYSQIVRTYSLTTVAILLSSACLLRAIRVKTKLSWFIYATSLAIALYSNILCGFVAIAHGVYIIYLEKFKLTKTLKSYLLSALGGGAAFLPWFILFITSPGLLGYSVAQVIDKTSPLSLLTIWLKNIRPIFIDINNPWVEFTHSFAGLQKLLFPFILITVLAAIYYLCRNPKPISIFLLCLLGFGGILLMIKDLIVGGTFSVRLRYMIPYVLGIELAVAYFLANLLTSRYSLTKKLAQIATSILICGGIISCSLIAQANSWWAFGAPDNPLLAQEISKAEHPVVIFADWGDALTMSYLLEKNVYSHLTRQGNVHLIDNQGKIYQEFSDIFLFKPSKQLQRQLQNSGLQLELLPISAPNLPRISEVWRVEKP
jgi:uncharacterized membrane protein